MLNLLNHSLCANSMQMKGTNCRSDHEVLKKIDKKTRRHLRKGSRLVCINVGHTFECDNPTGSEMNLKDVRKELCDKLKANGIEVDCEGEKQVYATLDWQQATDLIRHSGVKRIYSVHTPTHKTKLEKLRLIADLAKEYGYH